MPADENDEEKRQDDAIVVVEDLDNQWGELGRYALTRAFDWCDITPEIVAWRGPTKPDEVLKKERLREVSCRTVLVNAEGFFVCRPTKGPQIEFYPCPIDEDLEEDIQSKAETVLGRLADMGAAESASYVHDELIDDFGEKVWVSALAGDAVAVNGELRKEASPPRGWVLTDRGGRDPSGSEQEIDKDTLIDMVADELSTKGRFVHAWVVRRVLDQIYHKDYIMWSSGATDTEIWTTKTALKKYEALQEERAHKREVERQRALREAHQREKEERQAKIKKGGWPTPLEWSPTGELP